MSGSPQIPRSLPNGFFRSLSGEGTDCTAPNCSSSPSSTVVCLLAAVSAVASLRTRWSSEELRPDRNFGRHPHLSIFLRIFLALLWSSLGWRIGNSILEAKLAVLGLTNGVDVPRIRCRYRRSVERGKVPLRVYISNVADSYQDVK